MSIINFTATNTSDLLSTAVNIFDDVKPIIFVLIAIFLGFFIARAIISILFPKEENGE